MPEESKSLSGARKKSYEMTALLATTLGSFLTPFMGSAINIAIRSIGDEFAVDTVTLSWINMSYLLAAAVFLVPFGRIADIYGRKKTFIYGILVYTASCIFSAVSLSAIFLIFSRILQGIGGAMIFGTGVAILTSVFPAEKRGKALGINVASVYSGLSLGPFIGGFLTQHFGWRSIFLAPVPLGLIIIVITLWKLSGEWVEAKGEKFDLLGSIIYGVALISLIYGLSILPEISGIMLIFIASSAFLAFILWESNTKNPLLNLSLFRGNSVFTFSNLAALINYSATFAVSFLLSLYLQYIKGFSAQDAGLILMYQPVVQAIFSPLAGRLSDKIEPRIVASAGMAVTVTGLLLLTSLEEQTSIEFIAVTLVLLGFGFGLFSSPNTNAVMSSVKRKFYGVASATLATMRLIGQTFSMGITTMIFTLYMGRVQITPEYHPVFLESVTVAFTVFSVLCFIGIFASLVRGKVR